MRINNALPRRSARGTERRTPLRNRRHAAIGAPRLRLVAQRLQVTLLCATDVFVSIKLVECGATRTDLPVCIKMLRFRGEWTRRPHLELVRRAMVYGERRRGPIDGLWLVLLWRGRARQFAATDHARTPKLVDMLYERVVRVVSGWRRWSVDVAGVRRSMVNIVARFQVPIYQTFGSRTGLAAFLHPGIGPCLALQFDARCCEAVVAERLLRRLVVHRLREAQLVGPCTFVGCLTLLLRTLPCRMELGFEAHHRACTDARALHGSQAARWVERSAERRPIARRSPTTATMGDKMEEDTPGPETRVPAPQKTPTVDEPLEVSDVLKQQFHGATVRQLNLLPPATAKSDTPVSTALPMARAHGGQCILVVDEEKLRGFVEMVDLVIAETEERLDVPLGELQRPFAGTKEAPAKPETYRVITPETELAELSVFFETHAFALVTDAERMSVQSVATPADLARYVEAAPVPSSLDARAAEEARKDRSLADMLRMLEQFSPLVRIHEPNVTDPRRGHRLLPRTRRVPEQRCAPVRILLLTCSKRLLALATEKFVADIASDAFQYARIRTNAGPSRARPGAGRVCGNV